MTMIVQKEKPAKYVKIGVYKGENLETQIQEFLKDKKNRIVLEQERLTSQSGWTLADSKVLGLKEKIEKIGKPLKEWDVKIYRGILTGYNDAFIIDTETRNRILASCKEEEERKRTEELIKPVLRGRDIERYRYKWAGWWVICIPAGWTNEHRDKEKPKEFFKKTFPALYNHFMSFANVKGKGKGLFDRDDQGDYWWELRPCDYYQEFEKEKIVWNRITDQIIFSYLAPGFYVLDSTFMITGKDLKFLIGMLNSKIIAWWIKLSAATLGEGSYGAKIYIEKSPLPPITPQNQPLADQIVQKVDEILMLTQAPDFEISEEKQQKVTELEKEIDQLVYKLYDLTEEEIRLIEI
jgi:hypothetical protein